MSDYLLLAATFVFLLSTGYTLFAFGAGRFRPGRTNVVAAITGFALLSADLWQRGQIQRGCPINTLFDVLVFISWSMVLIYLVVGPAYRLSLLGAFTSAFVLVILLIAQLAPLNRTAAPHPTRDPWVEFHAALSLIAYGAFALAALAGLMYLLQDRELKKRRGGSLLYNLPPVTDLSVANGRLILLGFSLLTVSFAAGLVSGMPVNTLKFYTSAVIWGVYGLMLAVRRFAHLSPRRFALLSMAVFLFALLALPGIQYLSTAK